MSLSSTRPNFNHLQLVTLVFSPPPDLLRWRNSRTKMVSCLSPFWDVTPPCCGSFHHQCDNGTRMRRKILSLKTMKEFSTISHRQNWWNKMPHSPSVEWHFFLIRHSLLKSQWSFPKYDCSWTVLTLLGKCCYLFYLIWWSFKSF